MKFPRFIAVILLLCNTGYSQLNTGVEVIITNQVYCVHSELRLNGNLINTSNIYCLKGTGDTLWIVSMGYGNPEDISIYRDTPVTTSLQQDLRLIDSVADLMSLVNPKPMCIAVHFHLDHCNQELWFGLDSLFGIMNSFIYIHKADYARGTCNSYCCGGIPCTQANSYFGAPFITAWTQPTIARFRQLGGKNDPCGKILKYITTASGMWILKKSDNSHTSGCVNLESPTLQYRINGADVMTTCTAPVGYQIFPIHGNCF